MTVSVRSPWRNYVPLLPAGLLLGILFVLPVGLILRQSFVGTDGALSLAHYVRLFQTASYVDTLLTTLRIASWTAVLSVLLAYPLAYLLARADASTTRVLTLAILVPYWAGVLVRTFTWMVLLGRRGPVNAMLIDAGIVDEPVRFLYNPAGVMVGMTNAYVPIAVLVMVSVMRSIDGRLSVVAATLGAGTAQGFWRIYFPLSMPGVAAALLLIFISSLGTFITPALLGSGREVMIAQVIIDQVDQVLNWGFAGAISLLLLVTTLLVYGVFHALFGASSLTGQQAGLSPSPLRNLAGRIGRIVVNALGTASDGIERVVAILWPRRIGRTGSLSPLSRLLAGLVLLFLLAPILLILPISFTGSNFIDWPPRNWSLRWYRLVLTSEQWTGPALRSFVVAIASAVLSVAIGLPAAMALSGARLRARAAILALILAPMIVPHILIAVALFFAFAKVGLVGTTAGLVLGHTVLCLPYVVVTLMAVFATYDQRLDQAADTLGASTWQRLQRVTIPLIRPGILAGLLIAFVTSFEELTVSMFLSGGLSATLPKQLWTEMLMAVSPALAAITCLMLAVVVVLTVAIFVFRRDGASASSSALRAH